MMIAKSIRIARSKPRAIFATLLSLSSLFVLLLGGCQSQEDLTRPGRDGYTTLAVGLSIPPPQFSDVVVGQGYNTPMSIAFDPNGRLYVVEKGGTIKMVGQSTPVLTTSQLPGLNQTGERGLLAVAFDPAWANPSERWMYVHWCHTNNNKISRILISNTSPYVATGTLQDVFNLSTLSTSSFMHNGGPMHFAADGTLFITTGDNGVGPNAQNTGNLIGKLLRINKNGTIPAGSPFGNAIWAYGLRNPYTFAIQPGSNRIFISDIGQDAFEEVNESSTSANGQNFGWPNSEGPTSIAGHTNPRISYVNGPGTWGSDCAVAGAAFYNPSGTPPFPTEYVGDFFYADMCSGYIKGYDLASNSSYTFATGAEMISDLRLGPDGALYYLIYRVPSANGDLPGYVGKIAYTGTSAPSISRQPASVTLPVGGSNSFTVKALGGSLTYQWQRNGVNIAGAKDTLYTVSNVQPADNNAQFRCVVTNSFGTATSNAAVLTVTSNMPPTATITSPAANTQYTAGNSFTFTGTGTDPEQGNLPASAYSWRVDFHHDTHNHPHVAPFTGQTGGSFTIPTTGETADNVFYRISLTVTDAGGQIHTATRDVLPRKATITVTSNPVGLTVTVDGSPKVTPYTFVGVAGMSRPLGFTSPQTLNGQTYTFASWSDGGAQSHSISTPTANTTYIANGAINLPGRIQAEDYKTGGQGVGYNDLSPGNTGTQYRQDGVDIEATTDVDGVYNVGWTQAGEWLEYSINVATAGNYNLTLRMASGAAGTKTAAVTVDDAPKATFSFTDASGWQSWRDVTVAGVNLTAGPHTLRITMNTGDFNLNYLNAALAGGTNQAPTARAGADRSTAVNALVTLDGRTSSDPDNAPQPLTYSWTKVSGPAATLAGANTSQPSFTPATAGVYVFRLTVSDGASTSSDDVQVTATGGPVYITLPGRIEAEAYQPGGENFGYHDLTAGNTGGQLKTDGVDIEATGDVGGGYNVGWIDAGEWLDYDVNVTTMGAYNLTARMASGVAGTKTVAVSVDGANVGSINFNGASGWQVWQDAALNGVNLTAGIHVIRFTMTTGNFNLNYVNVTAAGGGTNLLLNGDFSNGIASWQTYFGAPATGTIANEAGSARISITNQGVNYWDIQLWQPRTLTAGKVYTLDFDIKAEATGKPFRVVVERNGGAYDKYYNQPHTVSAAANAFQHFTLTWTQPVADATGRVMFVFGGTNVNDAWIDNVVLK